MAEGTPGTRGQGNVLITPAVVAREYLMRLIDSLIIPRLASFDYRKYYANAIGNTITIKKPYFAFITSGRSLTSAQINPMVDETVTLAVDKRWKGALKWNDVELTLDISQFSQRYLDTIVEQMGYRFDQDGGGALAEGTFMISHEPGTALTQDLVPDIRAYAIEVGIPSDMNNFGLINPIDSAQIQKDISGAAGASGKFNEAMVKQAIEAYFVGPMSQYRVFETNHIPDMRVRKAGAAQRGGQVRGANQRGDTLNIDGLGVNNAKVFYKGQLIKLQGVEQMYPRRYDDPGDGNLPTKISTGRDMTFAILEDASSDGTGQATLKISPPINDGNLTTVDGDGNAVSLRAFQNVSAAPADNAAITVVGWPGDNATADVSYRQNVFYHRKALHYVPVELERLRSATREYTAMDAQTNLTVSALQYLDGAEREETLRLDTLYGVKNIYPDLCIRHVSTIR